MLKLFKTYLSEYNDYIIPLKKYSNYYYTVRITEISVSTYRSFYESESKDIKSLKETELPSKNRQVLISYVFKKPSVLKE